MAKSRAKKPKQGVLDPDFSPPSIPDLDAAAELYYDTMMERVVLSKSEDEAKDALIDKMKEHGLDKYEYDEKTVFLTAKSGIKIKKKKEASGDDPNEFREEGE